MQWTIRTARLEDPEHIIEVELDAGERFRAFDLAPPWETGEGTREAYLEPLKKQYRHAIHQGTLWVAADAQDHLLGFAFASEVDEEGHMREIDVRRAYGRQGDRARTHSKGC